MKITVRRSVTLVAAAAIAALVAGPSAFASTTARPLEHGLARPATPPWEPDHDSVGGLLFYNSSGQVITSGSTDDSPVAAYVEGTSTIRAGDTRATLFGYLPVKGENPGEWSGQALGSSTVYPVSGAPSPVDSATAPVESGASGDETIAQLAADFPNTDTSSDGYAGLYQLRLRTSGPDEGLTTSYDSADIEISGSTWSVVYSAVPQTATTIKLSVSPATSAYHGSTVHLAASVTPVAAKGTIQFFNGSSLLGQAAAVNGAASLSTSALSDATHDLYASFVPTTGSGYAASRSGAVSFKVSARLTSTTLRASAATAKKGGKVTLKATESPAEAGSISFYEGATRIAKLNAAKGSASYTASLKKAGKFSFTARFAPSNAADYASSASKAVVVTVKKKAVKRK